MGTFLPSWQLRDINAQYFKVTYALERYLYLFQIQAGTGFCLPVQF